MEKVTFVVLIIFMAMVVYMFYQQGKINSSVCRIFKMQDALNQISQTGNTTIPSSTVQIGVPNAPVPSVVQGIFGK